MNRRCLLATIPATSVALLAGCATYRTQSGYGSPESTAPEDLSSFALTRTTTEDLDGRDDLGSYSMSFTTTFDSQYDLERETAYIHENHSIHGDFHDNFDSNREKEIWYLDGTYYAKTERTAANQDGYRYDGYDSDFTEVKSIHPATLLSYLDSHAIDLPTIEITIDDETAQHDLLDIIGGFSDDIYDGDIDRFTVTANRDDTGHLNRFELEFTATFEDDRYEETYDITTTITETLDYTDYNKKFDISLPDDVRDETS